jgi:hypothetical protein
VTEERETAEPAVAVRLRRLEKVFRAGQDAVRAVDGVDLEIADG